MAKDWPSLMELYSATDLRAELGHALDGYTEYDGVTFDLAYSGESDAIVTATAPDGETARFRLVMYRLDNSKE